MYRSIGGLTPKEAERALKRPAEELDVAWSPEAVELVVSKGGGYPFFLQAFANASWNHAVASPITAEDANVAIGVTRTSLDTGFYGSRWERATSGQREYLHAMALEGETLVPTRSVAQRLEKRTKRSHQHQRPTDPKRTHLCARTRLRHLHRARHGRIHQPPMTRHDTARSCTAYPRVTGQTRPRLSLALKGTETLTDPPSRYPGL